MSPRTGRPKSEKPKSTQLAVRLDDETIEKLDKVAVSNSETRVQTIRRGIEKLYSELAEKNRALLPSKSCNTLSKTQTRNPV